jgi:hypothetical protein
MESEDDWFRARLLAFLAEGEATNHALILRLRRERSPVRSQVANRMLYRLRDEALVDFEQRGDEKFWFAVGRQTPAPVLQILGSSAFCCYCTGRAAVLTELAPCKHRVCTPCLLTLGAYCPFCQGFITGYGQCKS